MSFCFPEFVDPLFLAEKGREFSGEVPLETLERLKDIVKNPKGMVKIRVTFGKDGKLSIIKGQIETVLQLECQNCLKLMEWPLNFSFNLAAVATLDEVNLLPDSYDPLLLEDKIKFKDIIEEEILLAIPVIPKHQEKCFEAFKDNPRQKASGKTNDESPFSILKQLKNTGV